MINRLTHAAIAFAVTAVLYQAYVLTILPFVEPAWASQQVAAASPDEPFETGLDALHKYRELLSAYFPPNHWCFARPPKTLENGQALIVFDDYTQSPTGEVRVPLCAIVFFPKLRDRGAPPPRDAIILESSGGAMLQLEKALDKGAGGMGRIQYGQLQGDVTIRSDMHEPGTHDDLRIVTRNLYMNEDLIHTDQPMDMKLGEHHAFGRELEIRRLKSDRPRGTSAASLYGSFEELVIKHDVSMTVAPTKLRLGGNPSQTPQATATPAGDLGDAKLTDAPIRIKSAGPFRIDFGSYAASFTDLVQVRQLHPDGKLDELSAAELKLFFTKTNRWNADEGATTAPSHQASSQSLALEPASLEAIGTAETPVVLKAPSHDATARCERLWIELGPRRITLEKGEEVVLIHRGAEIHAPEVQYQLPPKESGQRIGALAATGGAGWLRAALDPSRPDQVAKVTWKDAMQVRRQKGQPVLVLDGRPTVSMTGTGNLSADRLQLFLRERPVDAVNQSSRDSGPLPASVIPEMISASGSVVIESAELTGKVNQLDVQIAQSPESVARAGASGVTKSHDSASPASLFNRNGGARRAYHVEGIELKVDVVMRNRRPDVRALSVDGNVLFQESPTAARGDAPLRIAAEKLQVIGADTPNARIDIRGGGGQNGALPRTAEITGRGARLLAPELTLIRGSNQAWINSPGQLDLLVDRDMTGNPLPKPEWLPITWQESMKLEGRRITFLGDVYVQSTTGSLRTRELAALTTADVRFDGAGGQQQPQLEQLECHDGAVAEFDQRDVSGVTSRQRVELQSLSVNQVTGAIKGEGPGQIDSVHLSKSPAALLALPAGGGALAPGLMQANPELRHLHIDFVRGVSGDLRTRTVKVHGNVQAVYGPVVNWDERLAMSPGGVPRPNEVWITCGTLGVTESPMAQLTNAGTRQVELLAEERVVIEGQDPQKGSFTANGHRAKFDQSKGLFILEGDGITPATIEQQQFPGAPSSPQSAQRMEFNQITGRVRIDGLHKGQFNQFDLGRQPGPTRPR
jgi:hypothetical protein